ncbi:hypothetical protein TSAR_016476 [Trichomalopsis sarcophagae]|uniref:Uncharacterized protein n=1 Tax=Trichomalopsis sarcophagae TaxID=543379 RepID=A0A232EKP3_9HYME|nr:hypothetical protein TSAR_016476 [Trichomalopsis sarcophagae]
METMRARDLKTLLIRENKFRKSARAAPISIRRPLINENNPTQQNETLRTNAKYKPLFCILPWQGIDKEKDEAFFQHFAEFGKMVYYETIRDKIGRLSYGNNKYNTHYNTEHMATDSHECSILQNKIRKFVDLTDYTMQPVLPRYAGTAENTSSKAMSFKLNIPFSDHYPLFISIDKLKILKDNKDLTCINYGRLVKIARRVEWNSVLQINDSNQAINELIVLKKQLI